MKQFLIELKQQIFEYHLNDLRKLYLPIIGTKAASLYQYLVDYSEKDGYNTEYQSLEIIKNNLQIDHNQLIEARKKIEAVGLMQTYLKLDGFAFIFSLSAPLTVQKFMENKFLYNKLKSLIGEIAVEQIVFGLKTKIMKKIDFMEISAKYHDVFEVNAPIKVSNTNEIMAPEFENKEEAIKYLTSEIFIRFLSKQKPSQTFLMLLNSLRAKGFSNNSLNLIIDYSNEVNGKVVAKHVETIAHDFLKNKITTIKKIHRELNNALKNKKKTTQETSILLEGGDLSINESFSDIFS